MNTTKKLIKHLAYYLIILFIFIVLLVLSCDRWIVWQAQDRTFNTTENLPYNKVGIVLGTSKLLQGGYENPYFTYRINAATELFQQQKISFIVVSGDNGHSHYNEAEDMQQALIAKGIPEDKIYLDYAGFRTLDSIYRMRDIFQQQSFTIISQEFHNQRALYIADYLDVQAVAFNAQDVGTLYGIKTTAREKLARVKVVFDRLFSVKPKFLGETIEIK